ncbi:putative polysaccharide biosynthesis protein [Sporolactobacillus terrae]|uniref:Transporter n=1 Tax=Sporolactobacillus terrae TaxID=269673 RepID=A0ABX5Q3L4_9BACL|nr:oligosaccharide flippase family protein [Sporolactobacillus terrae]QAA21223.1 transporter [Sporolactobacillus terrae]QAA24195.1 transporter [Sporolactobacillus terrae]UAK16004.1 oligosaccharide flippase family protein [Sporolactobacillus terrae]
MNQENKGSHRVWKGALILTAAALLVKLMSALYRLPYQNFAGDVGFYVYQQVYPFYALAAALGTTGFPIVISKYMAEASGHPTEKAAVARHAGMALLLLCTFFFVGLFFFADFLTAIMGDRHLTGLIRVASAAYLFVPLVALLRGTFQGNEANMLPTALSQIGEQTVRVCFILGVSWYLFVNHGDPYAFGFAATAGSAFAPLVSLVILMLFVPHKKTAVKRLLSLSDHPVRWRWVKKLMISGCLFSVLAVPLLFFQLIDSLTVLRLLEQGQVADARAVKGIYDRAYILTQFGMIAAASLTAAIVPRLSQLAVQRRHHDFRIEAALALKISLAFGTAAAAGLMSISREVNIMLFRNANGTLAFALAALTMLTLSLMLTASGIWESAGKPWMPFLGLIVGACAKTAANFLLIPRFSIVGAALATCTGTLIAAGLNVFYLRRAGLTRAFSWLTLVKLASAIAGMATSVFVWKQVMRRVTEPLASRPAAALCALSAAMVGGVVFVTLIWFFRFLDARDLVRIPFAATLTKRSDHTGREAEASHRSSKL